MAADLVKCDPYSRKEEDVLQLIVIRADRIRRGDYIRGQYGWEPVLMVGGEKIGVTFIYLYFGRERIGYEYWDCMKFSPEQLITVARKEEGGKG